MKYWEEAEHELSYRIKQEACILRGNCKDWEVKIAEAKTKLKKEIELRAHLKYCANNEYELDGRQAKREWEKRADFYSTLQEREEEIKKKSAHDLRDNGAFLLALVQLISEKAYFIYINRENMRKDWYDAENRLMNEITKKTKEVRTNQPYLSEEEAINCAKDQLHEKIEQEAYYKWKWVSERAYYISREKPDNSASNNWYIAAKEYDEKR